MRHAVFSALATLDHDALPLRTGPAWPRAPGGSALAVLLVWAAALALGCAGIVQRGDAGETTETAEAELQKPPFPWIGERLEYTVRHAATGAELLNLSAWVGPEAVAEDGTHYIPLSGAAESVSLARFLARVNDTAETFIDPKTWRPIYAVKELHENEEHRTYHVWFWPDDLYASVEKHKGKNVHKRLEPLPADTLDAISWIYHLRTIELDPHTSTVWYVYDGWILSRLTAVVQPLEDVWTPLGFYEAHRIDVYREKLTTHWPQGALSGVFVSPELTLVKPKYFLGNVWLAADEPRTPVRLAIETKIGDLDLLLRGYSRDPAVSE